MSNRILGAACGVFVLTLAACPKKTESVPDAAVEPIVPVAVAPTTPAPVVDAATPLVGAASTAAAAKSATSPTVVDASVASPDAAAPLATTSEDAGAASASTACCCEVTGQPLATLGMSECTKTKKGQCVKKDRCAVATGAATDGGARAGSAVTPPIAQTCCCDVAGKKDIVSQSECAKGGKGRCVKAAECVPK